jgi:hypothetical protein
VHACAPWCGLMFWLRGVSDAIAVPPAVLAVSSSSYSHIGGGRTLSSPLWAGKVISQGNVISLWVGGPFATSHERRTS